jgi:hypothetical protein
MTRRIVEIKETGSNYFERAIFFVRMDMPQNTTEYTLTQEASRIIEKFRSDLKLTRPSKKYRFMDFIKLAVAAAAGAAAAVLVLKLGALI